MQITKNYSTKILGISMIFMLFSCQNSDHHEIVLESKQNNRTLELRALKNNQSRNWNHELLSQDIASYNKFSNIFDRYPLNNYPFPVANYDYSVYSNPFTIKKDSLIFKGILIGDYKKPESDQTTVKLSLIVLTNNDSTEAESFVNSRNFPYLTAEGSFNLDQARYKWVFSATPDGFSSLFFSMKFFDLRYGQTIVIYPQADQSFFYMQLNESPSNYTNFDDYIKKIKDGLDIKIG